MPHKLVRLVCGGLYAVSAQVWLHLRSSGNRSMPDQFVWVSLKQQQQAGMYHLDIHHLVGASRKLTSKASTTHVSASYLQQEKEAEEQKEEEREEEVEKATWGVHTACRHAQTRSKVGSIQSTCSFRGWSCLGGGGGRGRFSCGFSPVGPFIKGVVRFPLCSMRYSW